MHARFIAMAAVIVAAPALRAQSANLTGCYRFNRPLAGSAAGLIERNDSAAYMLQLLPGGRVARPAVPSAYWRSEYARSSRWSTSGDTLQIRLSTSLTGWDISLIRAGSSFVGSAHYLTDAVGSPAYVSPVQAVRITCEPSHDSSATVPPATASRS